MIDTWKKHYWHSVPCMRSRIEEIVRRADAKEKNVLEVGCNEGFLSKALLENGAIVESIDIDERMVQKAFEFFGIIAKVGDINRLNYDDSYFDIIIAGEVLEHIDNPFSGLCECLRVAKEKVIISLPIGQYWNDEITHKWQIECNGLKKNIIILEFLKGSYINLNNLIIGNNIRGCFIDHDSAEIKEFQDNTYLDLTLKRIRN